MLTPDAGGQELVRYRPQYSDKSVSKTGTCMSIDRSRILERSNYLSFLLGVAILTLATACSLDAQILTEKSLLPGSGGDGGVGESPVPASQRSEPDFIAGETVTTGDGVIFKGVFGEISERQTLDNGVVIEGVFYD